ncbi:BnaC04g22300D [Brassica napus]|uniref:BnaC04g22300D protein n=1 Tax=Brassica napus TaxID=3708 RepID=A0A078HYA8_BRANA|nr:BnaC04g22300D [Brassica napus]
MSDGKEKIGCFMEALESLFISGINGDDVPHSNGNIISVSYSLCVLCRVFDFSLVWIWNFESKFEVHDLACF